MSGDWSHGLFGCLDDITVCKRRCFFYLLLIQFSPAGLLAWIAPCYIYGKTAETLGESCIMHAATFLIGPLAWYCMANTRGRIREQKGIDVS